MNEFSIRITHRREIDGRAVEDSIEVNSAPRQTNIRNVVVMAEGERTAEAVRTAMRNPATGSALEWSATLCNGERVKFAAAEKACTALGEGWRLPTRIELLSLVDDTRSDPAIDTDRFPDTKSGAYWTGNPLASASSYAWVVHFGYGDADYYHRDDSLAFVRAVRAVPAGQ